MGYRYKRNNAGEIASRKSRCSARRDKMLPYKHYDPSKTTTYIEDKTKVSTLFGIAATHRMHIEHIDIKSAYFHEKFAHNVSETVYVKQSPHFNGTYMPQCQGGKLNMDVYGTPSAGHTYLTAVLSLSRQISFSKAKQTSASGQKIREGPHHCSSEHGRFCYSRVNSQTQG